MKNKKSLIAVFLIIFLAVGATFAYFTTTGTFTNLFNLGNYSIVTEEVFESPDDWSPGDTTPKTITTTNAGTINAAVRVKYIDAWYNENDQQILNSGIPNNAVIINFKTPSNWTYNSTDGYYYYNYYLKPGESTTSLIESVTLNSSLGEATCTEVNDTKSCRTNIQGLAGFKYKLTFTIETVQYDHYESVWNTQQSITEKPLPLVQIMNSSRTKDNLQVGDEICVNGDTTECFNFIRYDGNNIVMLSKWNLNVGSNAKDTATNLQDSDVKGDVSSGTSYGNVAFSETNYWDEGGILKSKYDSSYPADVYDTDYSTASGNNYSIAYYVENYKDILETYGLTVQSARLLTYGEATTNVGCDYSSSYSCPSGFIINTSFWLGSAGEEYFVMLVHSGGSFTGDLFSGLSFCGVRPVIVISKSEIE